MADVMEAGGQGGDFAGVFTRWLPVVAVMEGAAVGAPAPSAAGAGALDRQPSDPPVQAPGLPEHGQLRQAREAIESRGLAMTREEVAAGLRGQALRRMGVTGRDGEPAPGTAFRAPASGDLPAAPTQPDAPPLTVAASVEVEDRAGDVIVASGWELEAYRQNPVVLWAHQHMALPIGRSLRTWVEGTTLMATIEFAPTPFAQQVRRLYAEGFMRGVSVGFRALEMEGRRPSTGHPSTGSGWRGGGNGVLFKRQELLEISAAPVPLNPGALAVAHPSMGSGWRGDEMASVLMEVAKLWRELAGMAA